MLINYIRVAWRNLARHKVYAAINISGLSVGIATCLILFTVVKYELSYDTFQPGYKRIYHVAREIHNSQGVFYGEGLSHSAYDALRASFQNVTTAALYGNYDSQVTVLDPADPNSSVNKKFAELTGNFFSDPNFFSVFQYKWLAGSPSVLKDPDLAVLTRKRAEKYFGKWQSAIGSLLKIENAATIKVAGIIEDVPSNSDFPLGLIASYETMKKYPSIYGYNTGSSITSNFQAFMLLPEHVSVASINSQLTRFSNDRYNTNKNRKSTLIHYLRPLSQIHFDKTMASFGDHTISKNILLILSLIGVFIIIMACINFINLSTAQAVGRSKEIGIRKVLGSNRLQIFWQVIGETFIIVVSAVILAIGIAYVCLPFIKHIISIGEDTSLLNADAFAFIAVVIAGVTLLAGVYPSLILSGFKPALALKNKVTSASIGGISLRRGLVVTQFAIAQVLIIGTIVAVSQMSFIQHADLGFDKEAVLTLTSNVDSTVVTRQPAFKDELLSVKGVQSVSFSYDAPSSEGNYSGAFAYDHRPDEAFELFSKFADEDYFNTYGLTMIAGRPFDKSDTTDEIVVNETLVKKLGITSPDKIIGHEIRIGKQRGRDLWRPVVGVVKDFKTNSLRESVKPLAIMENNKRYYYTGIKLNTSDLAGTQASIEKVWGKLFPEFIYQSRFVDERINDFYSQENQLALLYKIFAGIAIFISCLGLYGLVLFMAAQKTKEVGIRKVLGATVADIIYLFLKEFTILIIIAFVVALPVAYYMMGNWLNNFVFRINMDAWMFLAAVAFSIVIAWISVGYKSVKAARANPVKSLRAE